MMLQVRRQQSERGEEPGCRRYHDAPDLQLAGDPRRVDWTTAAESKQRELAWITSALAGNGFDGTDHTGVCQLVDSISGVQQRQANGIGNLLLQDPPRR